MEYKIVIKEEDKLGIVNLNEEANVFTILIPKQTLEEQVNTLISKTELVPTSLVKKKGMEAFNRNLSKKGRVSASLVRKEGVAGFNKITLRQKLNASKDIDETLKNQVMNCFDDSLKTNKEEVFKTNLSGLQREIEKSFFVGFMDKINAKFIKKGSGLKEEPQFNVQLFLDLADPGKAFQMYLDIKTEIGANILKVEYFLKPKPSSGDGVGKLSIAKNSRTDVLALDASADFLCFCLQHTGYKKDSSMLNEVVMGIKGTLSSKKVLKLKFEEEKVSFSTSFLHLLDNDTLKIVTSMINSRFPNAKREIILNSFRGKAEQLKVLDTQLNKEAEVIIKFNKNLPKYFQDKLQQVVETDDIEEDFKEVNEKFELFNETIQIPLFNQEFSTIYFKVNILSIDTEACHYYLMVNSKLILYFKGRRDKTTNEKICNKLNSLVDRSIGQGHDVTFMETKKGEVESFFKYRKDGKTEFISVQEKIRIVTPM